MEGTHNCYEKAKCSGTPNQLSTGAIYYGKQIKYLRLAHWPQSGGSNSDSAGGLGDVTQDQNVSNYVGTDLRPILLL